MRYIHITRFISCLLLLLFALSITPKKYLHSAFAKHIDNKIEKPGNSACQVTIPGFNCDDDNLVAESSFIVTQNNFDLPAHHSFSSFIVRNISFSFTREIYSSLRGPPVSI